MKRDLRIAVGWLIDGSGGPVRQDRLIEVRNGRITAVRPLREAAPPDGVPACLDLRGHTLLPVLVDSHVHLAMPGTADPQSRSRQLAAGYRQLRPLIAGNLERHRACGVLGVRDGGDRGGFALRFRLESRDSAAPPVCAKMGGVAWHKPGRYGRTIGRALEPGQPLAGALDSQGCRGDLFKVVNSGLNSLSEFAKETAPQFDLAELRAAVKAAARCGLPVMVHANGRHAVEIAVAASCRSVEHGFFMGAENLARMAESGTVWVPTAVTMLAYIGVLEAQGGSADVARRTLDHQLEQLRRARQLGATVAVGTDAGSPGVEHGAAVAVEMQLLMEAGFSPAEAVRCASANGAALLGADFGLLAGGRPASFLAVPGGPEGLPGSLAALAAVYLDGEPVMNRLNQAAASAKNAR
jgi:imidazolonepropionase-like amidohydrolase